MTGALPLAEAEQGTIDWYAARTAPTTFWIPECDHLRNLDRTVHDPTIVTSMAVNPPTEQGRATRERIVATAAQLIGERGSAATSLEDVMAATRASKSQLYHYFGEKHGLVEAVVEYQSATVLEFQVQALASVHNWQDLEGWADAMVAMAKRQRSRGGCPIGTLAAAVADTDEALRELLNGAFDAWRDAISGALERLRDNHLLARDADLDALTTFTLSAIEGGLLLATTTRDSTQLRIALDGAIAHLRAHARTSAKRTTKARDKPGPSSER